MASAADVLPAIDDLEFAGLEGTVQAPSRGVPRESTLRTRTLASDYVEAYRLAMLYRGLIDEGERRTLRSVGGWKIPVIVKDVQIEVVRTISEGALLRATWTVLAPADWLANVLENMA